MNDQTPAPAGDVDVRVGAAAVRYIHALDEERRIRSERNACTCERVAPQPDEHIDPADYHSIGVDNRQWQEAPCWKAIYDEWDNGDGDRGGGYVAFGDTLPDGWCASCERRRDQHTALRAATRARVGALTSLRYAVRRVKP